LAVFKKTKGISAIPVYVTKEEGNGKGKM
jgi:hypothetical protein